MTVTAEDVVQVVAHEEFDDETLLKHLNARHMPLAGMDSIPSVWSRYSEPIALWREYHKQVHELAVPYGNVNGHVHREMER